MTMPSTKSNDPRLAKTLRMIEFYVSVQGESTWAGLPCVFIRLARCNLRCTWCDTEYSFKGGEKMTLQTIIDEVKTYGVPLVELTGGEPLAQPECIDLAELLVEAGYEVLIETSGSLPINTLPDEVVRIMDLKCPDSGMCDRNLMENIEYLDSERDEVKFVLASRKDYEWCRHTIKAYNLEQRCKTILLSPVFGQVEAQDIVQWILDDDLPVRFQLQMHKFIWPPDQKGV